jgi:hypothetical protein
MGTLLMTSSNVIATANTPSLSDSIRCKLHSAVMFDRGQADPRYTQHGGASIGSVCAKSNPPDKIDGKFGSRILQARSRAGRLMKSLRENALVMTAGASRAGSNVLIALVVAHHSVEAYVAAHPPEVPLSDTCSIPIGTNETASIATHTTARPLSLQCDTLPVCLPVDSTF